MTATISDPGNINSFAMSDENKMRRPISASVSMLPNELQVSHATIKLVRDIRMAMSSGPGKGQFIFTEREAEILVVSHLWREAYLRSMVLLPSEVPSPAKRRIGVVARRPSA